MESVSMPVRQLCNTVARFAGATAVANGYISFGDQETFGNHWDTHDVFAVQLIGRKRWLVYEPTYLLPMLGQTSLHHKHECPAVPVIDEILEAGDILYIPRGWWHTAVPLREETFHVAIGTHPHTMQDYISWVMKNRLPQHLSYRQSLRMDPSEFGKIAAASCAINAEIFNEDNFTAFQRSLLGAERVASSFNVARDFSPQICLEIESGQYVVNSKSSAAYLQAATEINGALVCTNANSVAVLRTLTQADSALEFTTLRRLHPEIDRAQMRLIMGDLMARDIVECRPSAELAQ
jgi:ribosomal protein L16 Arg81 hydroxylase